MLAAGRLAQEPRASCALGPASSLAEAGGFCAVIPVIIWDWDLLLTLALRSFEVQGSLPRPGSGWLPCGPGAALDNP